MMRHRWRQVISLLLQHTLSWIDSSRQLAIVYSDRSRANASQFVPAPEFGEVRKSWSSGQNPKRGPWPRTLLLVSDPPLTLILRQRRPPNSTPVAGATPATTRAFSSSSFPHLYILILETPLFCPSPPSLFPSLCAGRCRFGIHSFTTLRSPAEPTHNL